MMVNSLSRVLPEVQGGFPLGTLLLVEDDQAGGGSTITASAIGNSRMFTARQFDEETGRYHYRARAYSPELRRFIQRDPLEYVDGPNASAYGRNRPIVRIAPSGEVDPVTIAAIVADAGLYGGCICQGPEGGPAHSSGERLPPNFRKPRPKHPGVKGPSGGHPPSDGRDGSPGGPTTPDEQASRDKERAEAAALEKNLGEVIDGGPWDQLQHEEILEDWEYPFRTTGPEDLKWRRDLCFDWTAARRRLDEAKERQLFAKKALDAAKQKLEQLRR